MHNKNFEQTTKLQNIFKWKENFLFFFTSSFYLSRMRDHFSVTNVSKLKRIAKNVLYAKEQFSHINVLFMETQK